MVRVIAGVMVAVMNLLMPFSPHEVNTRIIIIESTFATGFDIILDLKFMDNSFQFTPIPKSVR